MFNAIVENQCTPVSDTFRFKSHHSSRYSKSRDGNYCGSVSVIGALSTLIVVACAPAFPVALPLDYPTSLTQDDTLFHLRNVITINVNVSCGARDKIK
jgi:hypothetical protein